MKQSLIHWLTPGALLLLVLAMGCSASGPDQDASRDLPDNGKISELGPRSDTGLPDQGIDLGPPRDIGPDDYDLGVPHELTDITIRGQVSINFSAPAPWVQVLAHCEDQTVEAITDDEGHYTISSNVERCNQLVLHFHKESYLPTYRVVHLPPPTSPVTLDVVMTALKELQCGSSYCVVEGDPISTFPPGPMTRGWISVQSGPAAVDFFGGEFRDTRGNLLWVTGFGYFDLRDDQGATLESFAPFPECFSVGFDALDQLVDVKPETDELLEMNLFTLDESVGRWEDQGTIAWVAYTIDMNDDGHPIIVPADRSLKDDIRSGQLNKAIWVCAPVSGSGWLAWGVSFPQRSCITLQAMNQCRYPLANVVFSVRGRGYGFKAETWTDRRGQACLEASLSEDLGLDYNLNELRGETFWVNTQLRLEEALMEFPSFEIPRQPASCMQPEGCIPLKHIFYDYRIESCL